MILELLKVVIVTGVDDTHVVIERVRGGGTRCCEMVQIDYGDSILDKRGERRAKQSQNTIQN